MNIILFSYSGKNDIFYQEKLKRIISSAEKKTDEIKLWKDQIEFTHALNICKYLEKGNY